VVVVVVMVVVVVVVVAGVLSLGVGLGELGGSSLLSGGVDVLDLGLTEDAGRFMLDITLLFHPESAASCWGLLTCRCCCWGTCRLRGC
jgi:hypothetical protein